MVFVTAQRHVDRVMYNGSRAQRPRQVMAAQKEVAENPDQAGKWRWDGTGGQGASCTLKSRYWT